MLLKTTDDKTEIVLAQWQTCVEMANSVSQRRDTMNNIFVTLNLAIVAAISINWDVKSLFILVAGIVVSVIWLLFIRNYKLLNTEKFNVINDIEKKLPVKPFNDEWKRLEKNKKAGIVKTYMAHHQSLILLAINNLFNNNILQKRFIENPEISSVSILLQE